MKTVGEMVERSASFHSAVEAVVVGETRWTYAQLLERATKLASALARSGVRRQDRVGMLAMNCAEYFDFFTCCHLAGFIASTVNFRLAPPEIHYVLEDSDPRVLIFEAQYAPIVDSLRARLPGIGTYICIGECPQWATPYDEFLESGGAGELPFRARPEDGAHLIYTSGTTGRPKGVIRSQAAELALARTQASMMEMRINGRILVMMPMFHLGAISMFLPQQLMCGTVVLHRKFDPADILATIEREKIVTTHMAPVMVQAVLAHPELDKYDLSSLETLCYSAAPMPVAVLQVGLERLGPVFLNSWGSTEVGSGTNFPKHMHRLQGTEKEVRRLASIGQPHVGCDIRVVDEHEVDCELGVPGEVLVRSPLVMSYYWNRSAATIATMRDGWVRTGDMAYFDEDSFLYLVDRKTDMIISGGENIYSQEVEQALALHSGVSECAVIGVADPRWGESVLAVIVRAAGVHATEDELLAHCQTRIARYKCPKAFAFVTELPRLPSGKVSKVELRRQFRGPGA